MLKKVQLYIFSFGLLILPFIYWPWAYVVYEIPRVWFFECWIKIMMIVSLLILLRKKKTEKQDGLIILLIIFLLFIIVVSSILGVDVEKSIVGNFYRRDGVLTYLHLVGLFTLTGLFWQDSWKKTIILVVSWGAFLSSTWSIYLGIRLFVFGDLSLNVWNGAIGGFFSQPQFLAGYLLVTLPIVCYWLTQKKNILLTTIFLGVQLIAVVLTHSFVASTMAILVVGLFIYEEIKTKELRQFKGVIVILLLVVVILSGIYIKNKVFITVQMDQGYFAQSRQRIAGKLLLAFFKKPIFGWGWANIDYAFESVDWPFRFGYDVYLDKAHSVFLEILIATGIVGFLTYLSIIGRSLYLLVRKKSISKDNYWIKTLTITLVIYLIHSQTNIISINEEIFFWIVLGIISQEEITY